MTVESSGWGDKRTQGGDPFGHSFVWTGKGPTTVLQVWFVWVGDQTGSGVNFGFGERKGKQIRPNLTEPRDDRGLSV